MKKNIKTRCKNKNYGTESELPIYLIYNKHVNGKIYYVWIVTYNFSTNILLYTIFVVSYLQFFDIYYNIIYNITNFHFS